MSFSIDGKKLFGITFSPRDLACRACKSGILEIGNWRAALDTIDNLGFNFLRIGAYWDAIEISEGVYYWEELDALLNAIKQKKKYGVLLTIGMKAPRWPEYYIPKWALPTPPDQNAEISKNQLLRERTLKFIEEVVKHCKNEKYEDVIKAWQVENEPMDRSGEEKKRWFIGADFVKEEAELIRSLDKRPLVINCWCELQSIGSYPWKKEDDEYAVKNAIDIGNILGLDIYPNIDGNDSDYERRTKLLPTKYIKKARDAKKDAWVIESQAEPWGKYEPNLDNVKWLVDQHIEQGFQCILLWGFEWWWEMRFTAPARSKEWFDHIRWEARRFGMLSRVFHNWTTPKATNLASYKGKLYLTVVGDKKQIWLLSSDDDGKNWTPSQVLADKNWQTEHPIGIAFSPEGKLYLTVVGDKKQIWLLSSDNNGKDWTPSQVLADKNWQTEHPIGIAVSQGKLYLTVVGDKKQIWLLSSDNNGKNWTPSQVLVNDQEWQTQHPIGIAVSQGKLYLTVVGDKNEIYLLSSDNNGKNWTPSQVLVNSQKWQTQHPIGIAFSQGKLYLTVVGNNDEIYLLSSKDENYNNWDAQSGIFKDWKTKQAISITEFKEGSNSSESRIHLSLVGLTEGEIYICTDNPVV